MQVQLLSIPVYRNVVTWYTRKMTEEKRYGPYTMPNGYRYFSVKRSDGSRATLYVHRLVMEAHLGRALRRDEEVHHQNENKGDNRPDNLEIKSTAQHTADHKRLPEEDKYCATTCAECGVVFLRERRAARAAAKKRGATADALCGKRCAGASSAKKAWAASPDRRAKCGTHSKYTCGCRCAECTAAHAQMNAALRSQAQRVAR